MRLIDADSIKLRFSSGYESDMIVYVPYNEVVNCIQRTPTVDAVPVSELLELRDNLYENDQITMRGLMKLNRLISEYDSQREAGHGR